MLHDVAAEGFMRGCWQPLCAIPSLFSRNRKSILLKKGGQASGRERELVNISESEKLLDLGAAKCITAMLGEGSIVLPCDISTGVGAS